MTVGDLKSPKGIKPLKHSVYHTPHAVIEPNTTCNLRCRACYNLDKSHVKSLQQVRGEIDLAVRRRRLETLSILGGEPTLHPNIRGIVAHVKKHGLVCQILTNGYRFLDGRDSLLDDLIAAGVDRIIVHVDVGQQEWYRDRTIDDVREALFSLLEKKRIFFALSITIYPENRESICELMRRYARYRFFDGVLVTLGADMCTATREESSTVSHPDLLKEYHELSSRLEVEPVIYLPSSLADSEVSWLIYFYYMNAATGETFTISPCGSRLFRRLYRAVCGRHFFAATPDPRWFSLYFWLSSLFEVVVHPSGFARFRRILQHSGWTRLLRLHYIVIQRPPRWNAERHQIQICYHCPDATVRNGRLTPVCLADIVNPLPGSKTGGAGTERLARAVFAHLREIPVP